MARPPLRGLALAGLALTFFGLGSPAGASSVTSVGLPLDLTSVSSGSLLTLLTVQASPTESGSVVWNGTTDIRAGNATPQSFTRSVAELKAIGAEGNSFGLVLSGAEAPGSPSVTLPKFTMRFFAADGSKLFDA